ncbi:hypothetical protein PFISCL1PPCAC_5136, partial [Pristionchus fissidentatus]
SGTVRVMRQWVGYLLFAVVLYLHITYILRDDTEEVLQWTVPVELPRLRYTSNCTMTTCLNVRRIGGATRLRVWIQPLVEMRDESGRLLTPSPSREFIQLRAVLAASEWNTVDEREAALVVPGVDFINQDRFGDDALRVVYDRLKEKFDRRLIIFSFHGRKLTEDAAVMASAQSISSRFRREFDVSLPVWRGDDEVKQERKVDHAKSGDIDLLIVQSGEMEEGRESAILSAIAGLANVVWLKRCEEEAEDIWCDDNRRQWRYEDALGSSSLVLISDDLPSGGRLLMEALRAGIVPLIVAPSMVLPMEEGVDWTRFSVSLPSLDHVRKAVERLHDDDARMEEMRRQGLAVYDRHFGSLSAIVTSSLRLIEGRLVPHRQWTYEKWNGEEEGCSLELPYLASQETTVVAVVVMEESGELSNSLKSLHEWKRVERVIVAGEASGKMIGGDVSHWPLPSSSLPDPIRWLMARLSRDRGQVFVLLRGAADDAVMMDERTIDRTVMMWRATPASCIFVANERGRVEAVIVHKHWSQSALLPLLPAADPRVERTHCTYDR